MIGSAASVTDGVLAMLETAADGLAVTSDGSSSGELQAFVTSGDIGRVFGDQPIAILREIRRATTTGQLRDLNHRARALAHQYLTSPVSVDWLARATFLTDVNIVKRLIALVAGDDAVRVLVFLWSVGTQGITDQARAAPGPHRRRRESTAELERIYERVSEALTECDYLARVDVPFDRPFHVASKAEWQTRYQQWLSDPVRTECTWPARCSICARYTAVSHCGTTLGQRLRARSTVTSCTCWPTTAWPACRR